MWTRLNYLKVQVGHPDLKKYLCCIQVVYLKLTLLSVLFWFLLLHLGV